MFNLTILVFLVEINIMSPFGYDIFLSLWKYLIQINNRWHFYYYQIQLILVVIIIVVSNQTYRNLLFS
jgi:hypothetical protein